MLYLRPIASDDATIVASWLSNKAITKYMSTVCRCKQHTPGTVRKDIEESDPEYERVFMACVKDEREREVVIGQGGIDDLDFDDLRGELFFLVGDQAYQGKGYGRKLCELLIEHSFEKLHLHSIFATVTVENHASLAIIRKCGFTEIGMRRGFNRIDGRFVDEVFFDMTVDDYHRLLAEKQRQG